MRDDIHDNQFKSSALIGFFGGGVILIIILAVIIGLYPASFLLGALFGVGLRLISIKETVGKEKGSSK